MPREVDPVLKERAVRMVLEVNRLRLPGDSGLSRAPWRGWLAPG